MNTRLTVEPNFGHEIIPVQRNRNLKRKAWMAVFACSAMFWLAIALMIWRVWGR
ncbi:YmiA family putative membrane protein [Erwinia psidii]|uniref:YmiA family putative membrane protein n=1 Tax=Erwinia psidii TaxID=69224 RepID=A0A3N6SFJ6_9GAMM|nr:YmiA family putative membrane protein [Erwinia psidii]MCX8955950.1 YmiA family putative membrane protein [Erwinia psidii]MCX8961322.1 YmiA family putative membrane protein [Erwinia psidii]MCX8963831.1 YmiA family putative membrane protein [Erwinia psidii]RQM38663.1 YmiA family putative membrane protein [Erwinia psidii]